MTKCIWGFHWLRAAQTKKQDTAIKFKTQAEILRSECLLQASIETSKGYATIMRLLYKCGVKTIQNSRARINTDYQGHRTVGPDPVFSQNQIAELIKYPLSLFLIAVFCIGEGAMIWLLTPIVLPGASDWLKIVTAAVLALLGMCCINYGLTWHFKYKEVRSKIPAAPASVASKYRDNAYIGYALIILTLVGLVASGFGRIYFLENLQTEGFSTGRIESLGKAGVFTSVFTKVVTVSMAILMGVMKQQSGSTGIAFGVYRAWHVAHVRTNGYYRRIIKEACALQAMCTQLVEKYWQLTLRLYELFKSDTGYDPKYEQLETEYNALKATAGFVVTDAVYLKFSAIQCGHEELFKYGIYNDPDIKAKLALAKEAIEQAKNHLEEHAPDLSPATKDMGHSKESIPVRQINGAVKASVIAAFAALSLFLTSCTGNASSRNNNVIVLADLSASRDSAVMAWYGQTIANGIICCLGSKDKMRVLPIDYASATYGEEIYTKDFSGDKYSNEYAGLQGPELEANLHKDSARTAAQSFLRAYRISIAARRKFSNGSDITGALQQAIRYRDESANNVIIIFSDMLQQTDGKHLDLERVPGTGTDYSPLLSRMDTCDLSGTKIIIVTGNQGNVSAEKFTFVKALWTLYIKKCGGTLVEYTSGSAASLQKIIAGK